MGHGLDVGQKQALYLRQLSDEGFGYGGACLRQQLSVEIGNVFGYARRTPEVAGKDDGLDQFYNVFQRLRGGQGIAIPQAHLRLLGSDGIHRCGNVVEYFVHHII